MGAALPVFLYSLARPKAPIVGRPTGLCAFLFLLSSIPWLPIVALLFPYFPKICFLRAQLRFCCVPSYLPQPGMDSSSSTLVALNNGSHRFWNFSKAGQSISDVSGLPKKTKLQFHLPSRVTFLSTSGALAKVFFVQDIWLQLN